MTQIVVEHTISMGHRLPSYDGICSSPHGHNVRVEVTVSADAFCDFTAMSDHLKGVLADLDHAMVLHENDQPLLHTLQGYQFRVVALSVEPTTEALAALVFNEMTESYRYHVDRVVVHETDRYSAVATRPDPRVRRTA